MAASAAATRTDGAKLAHLQETLVALSVALAPSELTTLTATVGHIPIVGDRRTGRSAQPNHH